MIKIKRENVASISFSMFIIKCIFFIYLFSVNIYSYPVGNERHKVVSIIWFTKIIMAVHCDSNSYEDIYNYFGEMECNTWANGGQAEYTQIYIYGIYKLSHLISMMKKIQLWTIHVPILFACNIWSVCGWFIWWRNGVGDRAGDHSVYHLSCQNSAYGTICLLTDAIPLIPSLQLIPQYTTKPSLSPTARIPLTISKPHAPHLPFTPSKPF